MTRCLECMEAYDESLCQCPYCGADQVWVQEEKIYLAPGTKLQNRYIVGKDQAKRETDIIYIGWDTIFERKVLIQEFFPDYCVSRSDGKSVSIFTAQTRKELFDKGLEAFISNGRKLMYLYREADIGQVYSCFQENHTAYLISKYYDLPVLRDYAEEKHLKPQVRKLLMNEAIEAVEKIQHRGILHGNISEDSFWVTPENTLILRTPEPARCICGHLDSLDYGNPGPWTDIYGLSAALFSLAVGKSYEEGGDFSKAVYRLKPNEKKAIKNGLEKAVPYRTTDIQNFKLEFRGNGKEKPGKALKRKDKKIPSQIIWGAAALSIALITGTVVFQIHNGKSELQFANPTEQDQVRVPNLVNLDKESADQISKKLGFNLEIKYEETDDSSIPAGRIIRQSPSALDGGTLLPGETISVTVSSGPKLAESDKEETPPQLAESGAAPEANKPDKQESRPPETKASEVKETSAQRPSETQAKETKPQPTTQSPPESTSSAPPPSEAVPESTSAVQPSSEAASESTSAAHPSSEAAPESTSAAQPSELPESTSAVQPSETVSEPPSTVQSPLEPTSAAQPEPSGPDSPSPAPTAPPNEAETVPPNGIVPF